MGQGGRTFLPLRKLLAGFPFHRPAVIGHSKTLIHISELARNGDAFPPFPDAADTIGGKTMRMRRPAALAILAAAAALSPPAAAQQTGNDTGIATETQERRSEGQTNRFPWDLLGLLGLAGLLGLRRRNDDRIR